MSIIDLTADLPDDQQLREFVGVEEGWISDEDLARKYTSAIDTVVRTCRRHIPVDSEGNVSSIGWPSPLVEAVLRRVQRAIAGKNLPLGVLDQASEYGPAAIPRYDTLIEELEGPYRAMVFGGKRS